MLAVPADSTLYNVYALDGPEDAGGVEHMIGTLKLDGALTTSKWGDENLFFRHQRLDDDAVLKEDWKDHYDFYSLDGKCPFDFSSE